MDPYKEFYQIVGEILNSADGYLFQEAVQRAHAETQARMHPVDHPALFEVQG